MAKKLSSDISLFAVTLILLGIGLVMVWSASTALAQERHDNAYYFLIRQVIWATVGLAGMVAAMRLDYRKLRQPVVVYSVVAGTTYLLCCDGLYETLPEETMAALIGPDLKASAEALLREALAQKARDNVTVALIRIVDKPTA